MFCEEASCLRMVEHDVLQRIVGYVYLALARERHGPDTGDKLQQRINFRPDERERLLKWPVGRVPLKRERLDAAIVLNHCGFDLKPARAGSPQHDFLADFRELQALLAIQHARDDSKLLA